MCSVFPRQLSGPLTRLAIVAVLASAPALARSTRAATTPFFADWSLQLLEWTDGSTCPEQAPFSGDPAVEYTYIPHPGGQHNWPALHVRTTCTFERLTAAGAPRGVMIRSRNCPFPYDDEGFTSSPGTIDEVLGYVPDIEYVFMDLEGNTIVDVAPNVVEVVSRARAVHPNVRLGNYAYYPGTYDPTMPYESQSDRTNDSFGADLNAIYLTSGLDVAMPSCYPYSSFLRHTIANHYSGTAPNVRAALFWAPIERLSNAKRYLPEGHMLIPWVAPFISQTGYVATPPPPADVAAVIQHFRLRGADAIYAFSPGASGHPDFDNETYRQFAKAAWLELNPIFDGATEIEVLNTDTDKEGGVEWSGIRDGDSVAILASNLSGSGPVVITLPDIPGLPSTATIDDGTHTLLQFTLCPADLDDSGDVGFSDILTIIGAWGPCGAFECPEDLNGNQSVDFADILEAIAVWGPCGA